MTWGPDFSVAKELGKERRGDGKGTDDLGGGAFVAILAIAYVIYRALVWLWSLAAPLFAGLWDRHPVRAAIVIGVLATSYGLFQLRQKRLRWYAYLEILFALLTAVSATEPFDSVKSTSSTETWIKVGAAAYLLVRGLVNLADARKKEQEGRDYEAGRTVEQRLAVLESGAAPVARAKAPGRLPQATT